MTEAQGQWLKDRPEYAQVQHGLTSMHWWVDQGYLWPSGRFSLDDGKTLFWHPYDGGAIRVGRKVAMV